MNFLVMQSLIKAELIERELECMNTHLDWED